MATTGTPRLAVAVGGAAIALLAAACGGNGDPADASASPSGSPGSPTTSASASASPASTLTPAQQQAFEEATDAVLAYRQTITDLYSGARTDLNDLNDVATGELLDSDLMALGKGLAGGRRVEPRNAEMALVWATPQEVSLESEDPLVVVRACIDGTEVVTIEADGTRLDGVQEVLDYRVVRTSYLPAPGWAVARVTGDSSPKAREC